MAAGTRATASTYWARTRNDTARNSFFTPRMERAAPGEERHAVTGPKTYGVSACLAAGRHVQREVCHKSGSPAPFVVACALAHAAIRRLARWRGRTRTASGIGLWKVPARRQPGRSPPPWSPNRRQVKAIRPACPPALDNPTGVAHTSHSPGGGMDERRGPGRRIQLRRTVSLQRSRTPLHTVPSDLPTLNT
jgi:hypothetical protein